MAFSIQKPGCAHAGVNARKWSWVSMLVGERKRQVWPDIQDHRKASDDPRAEMAHFFLSHMADFHFEFRSCQVFCFPVIVVRERSSRS